jgi:hypothetical protein
MRLGLVERQPVPSARRYLEAYRERSYALTESGRSLADIAESNPAAFYDTLTNAVLESHPYFRTMVTLLDKQPLICPEVGEGEVEEARRDRKGLDHWSAIAIQRLGGTGLLSEAQISEIIASGIRRRFGSQKPASKALAEALNDAFAAIALAAKGLAFGATDLNILRQWGMQLRVLDQSRYVPAHQGANVIWLAATVNTGTTIKLTRKGLSGNIDVIANALVSAYRNFADQTESSLAAPYAPIFKIRASAAFECRVTRALVDMVIERLGEGGVPNQPVRVLLHLGTTRQPASEPLFRRGGSRRYEMTIHRNIGD